MPAALFPNLDDRKDLPHDIVPLAREYGILLGKMEERTSISAASSAIAGALGLEVGAPILVLDRLIQTLDGRPVEWRLGRADFANKCYLTVVH